MTDTNVILYLTVSTTALFLTTICFFAMYVIKRNQANSHKSMFSAYENRIEALNEFKTKCVNAMAESAELKIRMHKADEYAAQLRKDFIEQSELATSWRQKYDKLEDENKPLESELDRGNEMISWLKADLKRAYDLLFQNEKVILELIMRGKFPDEKGNYKVNRLSRNGVTFEAGEYLHSLYESKIAQQKLGSTKIVDNIIKDLDNLFKKPFSEKRPKGWNLKVAPRDKSGRVMKMSERVVWKEFNDVIEGEPVFIPKTNSDIADEKQTPTPVKHLREVNEEAARKPEIDWSVPQPFPEGYKVPEGVECVALIDSTWKFDKSYKIPKGTKVVTIENSKFPFVERMDGVHRQSRVDLIFGRFADQCYISSELAPIDPHHHPNHPFYGVSKKDLRSTPDGWGILISDKK